MYNLVFALFSAECSLLTFFLLPIPLSMRKQALKFLSTNAIVGQILYAARIAMIGVALLFLDAWRVVYSESSQTPEEDMDVMGKKASAKSSDHHHHYGVPFEPHARLWRAQRNLCEDFMGGCFSSLGDQLLTGGSFLPSQNPLKRPHGFYSFPRSHYLPLLWDPLGAPTKRGARRGDS